MPDLNRSLLSEGENAGTLGGLSGVSITSPEEFQSLAYNGTEWVNSYAPTVTYVQNAEANTLTTGTVVYLFGGTGDHASVKRADYTSDATSSKTVGVVGANIAASQNGPIITRGYVDGIDLSVGYAAGDVLWLGAGGVFTKTKAVAPNHLVFIGVVVRATVNGMIYVATQNGYELDELHNVQIANTLASGDFLKYNGTLWVNDPINLGTDTVGNYMSGVTAGNLITVTHTPAEGSNATIAVTSGTSGQIIVANATGVPTWVSETGDISISDTGVTSITSNVIVNADINTAAAIDLSKLASGTAGRIVLANATGVPTYTAVSGDIAITNAGVTSITTSANPTIAGLTANSATGKVIINTDAGGSVSIGNTAGVASTPYIDFNSGATAVDFDARIQSSGGSGVSGGGTLTITSANTIISGNLTINGTTTTVNTATLNVSDNIIILNNDVTGTPTENAGIEVERGTSPNVSIRWNETTDKWQFTTDGTNYTDLGAGGASISDTAPASPTAGQVWFESDTAQTFVYYDSHWIEIGASGTAAYVADTTPSNPITGQIWYNSSNGGTYVYYDSFWVEIGVNATLSNNSITNNLIADYTITATKIANTTITAAQIANTTITAAKIANATITNTQLAANVAATNLGFTPASTGKAIAMAIVFGG